MQIWSRTYYKCGKLEQIDLSHISLFEKKEIKNKFELFFNTDFPNREVETIKRFSHSPHSLTIRQYVCSMVVCNVCFWDLNSEEKLRWKKKI